MKHNSTKPYEIEEFLTAGQNKNANSHYPE